MGDTLRNLIRLSMAVLLAVTTLTALPPKTAHADAVTYSSGKRVFRVGILLVDSTTDTTNATTLAAGPENPDPYVFDIADLRKDVKPVGWEFVNPLAPRTVTQDILTRWTARDPNNPYQLGTTVTKDMAAYWEVSLTKTSVTDLLQFDALLLTTHRLVRFTPADREKLRKVVDAGGMIWVDDCGGMRMSAAGPFFLEQLQFQGGGGPAGGGTPVVFQPNHAILNTPYKLSLPQIALIGEYTDYRLRALAAIDPNTGNNVSAAPNPNILTNVVGNSQVGGGLPYIAVGNYGSGMVVATAGDSGCAINDYVGGNTNQVGSGPNSGAYMRNPRLERAQDEDLLFLYNLVQLGASNNTYRRNNRRVGSSGEVLRAPLTTAFDFTAQGTPPDSHVNSMSAPLVVRDKVYVSGIDNVGAVTIRCYNAKPSFNQGDQGIPDLAFGAPYDEIWRATMPNPVANRQPSAPVLATVYEGTNGYHDYIFVTLGNGSVVKFNALPVDGAGNLVAVNPIAGVNPVILKGTPNTYEQCLIDNVPGPAPAPAFFENRVYVAQPDGVVRCIDANSFDSLWTSIDAAVNDPITPIGTPTLGVVRQQETGQRDGNQANLAARSNGSTSDIMLYVPMHKSEQNGTFTAKIMPFWLGTRHEVIESQNGTPGNYSTRVALDPRVWIANTAANPLPVFLRPRARVYNTRADMDAGIVNTVYTNINITDNGVVEVRDGTNNPPPPGTPLIVSVDYDTLAVPVTPAGPGVPPGLAANPGTDDGARRSNGPDAALDMGEYSGGMEMSALGAEDIQFFSAAINTKDSSNNATGTKTLFMGVREQFSGRNASPNGATKLRQSFAVLEDSQNPANMIHTMQVNVSGQTRTVTEINTFRNPFQSLSGGTNNTGMGPGSQATLYDATVNGGLGAPLSKIQPLGAPVISQDGSTVYQLMKSANNLTIIAAFDADRDVTLRIKPFNPAANVTVQQANAFLHPDNSNPIATVQAVLAGRNPNAAGNNNFNGVLDGDADAGRITIRNMATGGGRFSSSQSFIVTYTPQGATQPVTEIISASSRVQTVNNAAGSSEGATLPQDYNPLLWYYVLPAQPTGAASRVGDLLYVPTAKGIVAVDADPTQSDPDVRAGEPVRNIVDSLDGNDVSSRNHVRWIQPLTNGAISVASVTAGPDILVANTYTTDGSGPTWLGTFAFENSTTLVADTNRIIEVSGDGTPLWAMDGTVDSQIVGGNLPIFDPVSPVPGSGRVITQRRGFTRPNVARRLSSNDYLVADTGNNRVVRATRSAGVTWELTKFNDGFGILEKSDPLTLNNPTDVQLYVQPTPDATNPYTMPFIGYEEHYLIADSGNNRIVEVVTYYDRFGRIRTDLPVPGGLGDKLVVWSSRTYSKQGRKLSFKSAQRVYTNDTTIIGVPELIATVDNVTAAGGDGTADFTGGSVVRLDYRPFNTFFLLRNAANGQILTGGPWPTSSGYPWQAGPEPATNGLVAEVVDSFWFKAGTLMPNGSTGTPLAADFRYKLDKPTFFQRLTLRGPNNVPRNIYLICDANGVYQVERIGTQMVVTWFMNQADYDTINLTRIRGNDTTVLVNLNNLPKFHPVSAQRLPNGNVLIANSASGPSGLFEGGQFRGETLEVTGEARFNSGGLQVPRYGNFSAPAWAPQIPKTGPRWAVVKQIMGASQGTQPLEQPLFADRL